MHHSVAGHGIALGSPLLAAGVRRVVDRRAAHECRPCQARTQTRWYQAVPRWRSPRTAAAPLVRPPPFPPTSADATASVQWRPADGKGPAWWAAVRSAVTSTLSGRWFSIPPGGQRRGPSSRSPASQKAGSAQKRLSAACDPARDASQRGGGEGLRPAGWRPIPRRRHYVASMLIASGADVKVVQARMRHACHDDPRYLLAPLAGQ